MLTEAAEADRKTALACIAIVCGHVALNDGERKLLRVIENEIRLAFDLEGAARYGPLSDEVGAGETPAAWFW